MRRSLLSVSVRAGTLAVMVMVTAVVVAWALVLGACGGKPLLVQECGNGVIEGSEICDATELGGQDCTDHGFTGGILACDADCGGFDTSGCGDFECGNGVVEPGESCEATDLDGQTCASQGFDGGTLACDADCGGFDTSGCTQPGCGDGVISGAEVCDGANLGGEDCGSQGWSGGTLACAATCGAFDTSGCTDWLCGDGVVDGPEVCDGANVGTLGCVDFGFIGGALVCSSDCMDYDRAGCSGAGCGNGIREPGEVCDLTDLGALTCQDFGYDSGILVCGQQCDVFDDTGCFDASCGDGTADTAEQCDGNDLRGADCVSITQGFMGGTLACDGACAYDTTSCTASPPPGDDCANAGVIPATGLPVSLAGDTTGMTNDYATAFNDCPDMGNEGANAPDVTYQLTPAVSGVYVFTLLPTDSDGAIYIVTDCADIPNSCVKGSEYGDTPNDREILDASLAAGTTYYIIVDGGYNGAEGSFTLGVDGPLPDPATLPGNDCSNAIVVTGVPYTDQGSTTGHSNDYTGAATCPGLTQTEGAASADVVYELTPTQTSVFHIDYQPTFDGALYVVTDCADVAGTCIGGSESASGSPPWNEVVDATLVAGTTYYIILDGGIPGSGVNGDYTLSISPPCVPDCTGKQCGPNGCGGSCGPCAGGYVCDDIQGLCLDPAQVAGEDCTNPVLVDPGNLPFVHLEDTTGSTDAASYGNNVCPGESGDSGSGAGDHAFELSPTVAGIYEISLTTYAWDGVVYVVTDCADIDNTCVYSEDDIGVGTETMLLSLDAISTYYIIVDGWGVSGEEGTYQLYVGQPRPPVPGNTCASAIDITAVPYSDSGDTSVGTTNDFNTTNGGCAGISGLEGETSPDLVYSFTPATTAIYTITYTPTFDGALYVATDCADIANTCLAGSEVASGGPPWDEVITITLTAGTTYYIFVDGGFNQAGEGPYTLEVSGP